MIHNFIVCLNAVIPLVLYLAVGMLVRKYSVLTEKDVRKFNKMVFVVFFPALMFENLYSADISEAFDGRLILFACLFVLAVCGITWAIVVRMDIPDRTRGAMIQAVYRSNFILMGLPVAENIYGKGSVSVTAALIMFVVPLYNFLAVIVLEYFRGGRADLRSVLKKILTNPIILGAVAAILALTLNISVPSAVNKTISGMCDATTPIAMILLGASFNKGSVHTGKKNLAICVLGRLVVVPAVGLGLAAMLGVRDVALVSLIAMMAAPPAVSSYTMAEAMDSDGELAGNAVIFATPLSCVTIFLWLFLFKSLGMF